MKIIGIDPGLTGALFYLNTRTRYAIVLDMPTITVELKTPAGRTPKKRRKVDPYALTRWLIERGPIDAVILEKAGTRPGEGAVGAFTQGVGYGIVQGVLVALQRPWQLVTPQAWTKALGVGADKGVHRQAAMSRYPADADLFARVKDDGRADAALIAAWYEETSR